MKTNGKRTACAECTAMRQSRCNVVGRSPPATPIFDRVGGEIPVYTGTDRISVLVSWVVTEDLEEC